MRQSYRKLLAGRRRRRGYADRSPKLPLHTLRRLIDSNVVGIIIADFDGAIREANDTFLMLLGYSRSDLLAGHIDWRGLTPPEFVAQDEHVLAMFAETGVAPPFEKEYLRRDGSRVPVLIGGAVLHGSRDRTICYVVDLSEQKRAAAALEESRHFIQRMADASPHALYIYDLLDGHNVYFNHAASEIVGLDAMTIRQMGSAFPATLIHPDDRLGVDQALAQLRNQQNGEVVEVEYRIRHASGEWRWLVERDVVFSRRPDGQTHQIVGTAQDITARKRAEEAERAARRAAELAAERADRLYAVTAALSEALTPGDVADVVVDHGIAAMGASAGVVLTITDDGSALQVVRSIGYAPSIMEPWQRFPLGTPVPLADAVRSGTPIWLGTRTAMESRYPVLASGGANTGHQALASIPLLSEGRAIGVLGIGFREPREFGHDDRAFILALAQQCAQALDRSRLYEAAQKAIGLRDEFLSIAAHELKTPVTSLLGYTQIFARRAAREGHLDARDQRAVSVIALQTERLAKLIDALLDLQRIETGKLGLHRARIDLAQIVRQVLDEVQPTLDKHAIDFHADEVVTVDADAVRIEQVVQNLLQNAIKYSPDGGSITITVHGDAREAALSVSDQGIGIPEMAIPNLFERFYRASNVAEESIAGVGIGLYVVKEIVTRHGGTIEVMSVEGRGSTFVVRLPLAGE